MSGKNERQFDEIALAVFEFQATHNPVYREYLTHLGNPNPTTVAEIPFLPIEFFKTREVVCGDWSPEVTFYSSGTTGSTSHHRVRRLDDYLRRTLQGFVHFFGSPEQYHIAALLPSYLEREGSSLIAMVDYLIRKSDSPFSGFYLGNPEELVENLLALRNSGKKTLLIGVTFALLQLSEDFPVDLSHCLIMETGGMKGRREEITREELHFLLMSRFNVPFVLSEYGMTELSSQAYSLGNGRFFAAPGMRTLIRDVYDPFHLQMGDHAGGINIVDLANIETCAFVETADIGRLNQDGSFEILGRMDNSDVRGCNLLVE